MGSNGLFSGTISMLEKNLDLRSLRHNLISSNIANKDTPNYKAFDVAVEEELKKLDQPQKTVLSKTHSAHITTGETDHGGLEATVTLSSNSLGQRADGNTVDIENEMATLAENSLLYETATQIIRKKFQGLKTAIQGGVR